MGWAAASASVSDLNCWHGIRIAGQVDRAEIWVSFQDTDDGVLERERLLDRDDLVLHLGDRDITLTPSPLTARLPPGAITITLCNTPLHLQREGLGAALLRAGGYGDTAQVVHEFLGDPPGGPASRRAGSLPNTAVLVIIVVPPPADPTLSVLPAQLDVGMGGFVPVHVQGGRSVPRAAGVRGVRAVGGDVGTPAVRVEVATQCDMGVSVATQCDEGVSAPADASGEVVGVSAVVSRPHAASGGGGAVSAPASRASVEVGAGSASAGAVTVPDFDVGQAVERVRAVQQRAQARHSVCVTIDERRKRDRVHGLVGVPRVESGAVPSAGGAVQSAGDGRGESWEWHERDEPLREACMLLLEEEVQDLSREVCERVCVEARVDVPRLWEGGVVGVGRPSPRLADWLLDRAGKLGGTVGLPLPDRMEEGADDWREGVERVGVKRRQQGEEEGEGVGGGTRRRSTRTSRPPPLYWHLPHPASSDRGGGQ